MHSALFNISHPASALCSAGVERERMIQRKVLKYFAEGFGPSRTFLRNQHIMVSWQAFFLLSEIDRGFPLQALRDISPHISFLGFIKVVILTLGHHRSHLPRCVVSQPLPLIFNVFTQEDKLIFNCYGSPDK